MPERKDLWALAFCVLIAGIAAAVAYVVFLPAASEPVPDAIQQVPAASAMVPSLPTPTKMAIGTEASAGQLGSNSVALQL